MQPSIIVTVKQIKPVTVACLNMQGDIGRMPAAFKRLYTWINEKGYKARGPAITVYHDIPGQVADDRLRWEIRSEISGDCKAMGPDEQGFGIRQTASIQAATVRYRGPYEKMEETYQALTEWIPGNGYVINGPVEELYYNNPGKPEELITEIRYPVTKK